MPFFMLKLHRHLLFSLQFIKKRVSLSFLLVIFNNVILTKKQPKILPFVLKITKNYIKKVNK